MKRRALFQAMAAAPAALLASRLEAVDYALPAEVFGAIDPLEAEVGLRLRALSDAMPAARAFAASLLRDQERQHSERDRLRGRLRLPPAGPVRAEARDLLSLPALRTAQQALVHAHAEGLPAIGDPLVVDRLARHMVELSRHLAVIDLWIEAEENFD
jgi:hypothetical protein